jgi:exonuclease III
VHKPLARHIYQVTKIDGYILALHFHFKRKKKLLIIQLYLPNDKGKNLDLQKQIQVMVKNERLTNTNIIIMSDFNAINNPIQDRTSCAAKTSKKKKKAENQK